MRDGEVGIDLPFLQKSALGIGVRLRLALLASARMQSSTSSVTCEILSRPPSLASAPHSRTRASSVGCDAAQAEPAREVRGARDDHGVTR